MKVRLWDWFGFKLGKLPLVILQGFRRNIRNDGVHQGFGVLQVYGRHLLYVGTVRGSPRLCVAFHWFTERA